MIKKCLLTFLLSVLFFGFYGIARATMQPELVKDINPVFINGDVSEHIVVNNLVYYSYYDSNSDNYYIYRHNLDTGKNLLISSSLTSAAKNFFSINNKVYFTSGENSSRTDLYVFDSETGVMKFIYTIDADRPDAEPDFKNINSNLYFNVFDAELNSEIYITFGSAQDTFSLKSELMIGEVSNLSSVVSLDVNLFFLAEDAEHGKELWKSGGMMGGAEMVKDVNPGTDSSNISGLTIVNGVLYFVAWDSALGRELWKSDGTASGTTMVKDINPGANSSNISTLNRDIFSNNGTMYFSANNGVNGNELWKSDGTASGTTMVKDINPGANSSSPGYFSELGGVVYFSAATTDQGRELWKTDGTAEGTTIVEDMVSGSGDFSPTSITNINGMLYFSAVDGVHGRELWKSNGLTGGTTMVKDLNSGMSDSGISNLQTYDGNFYFKAFSVADGIYKIWQSNGTTEETDVLDGLMLGNGSSPSSVVNIDGVLYFAANDGTNGNELWKSDGTASGTVLIKDIRFGSAGSDPYGMTNINGTLFFVANDGSNGNELWKSDGTASGTVLVKNINSGSNDSFPGSLTNVNGILYFSASNGTNGNELWKSDGTASGTVMVKDLYSGVSDSQPIQLISANGLLFFRADTDGVGAWNLFRSDGSDAGTFVLGYNKFISPLDMISFKNKLYFSAESPTLGEEIWSSDGTEDGTNVFTEIISGVDGSHPRLLTKLNENLFFFTATDNVHGQELWKSDGTASGTVMVKDIWSGSQDTAISLLTAIGDKVYFSAEGDQFSGTELWKSDGTVSGTSLVKDLTFMPMVGTVIGNITKVFNKVYFTAENNYIDFIGNEVGDGDEMWKTDGTSANTVMVNDFNEGINSSLSSNLNLVNNYLYFTADDGRYGRELWRYQITAIPVSTSISPNISSGIISASTTISDSDNDPVDLYIDYSLDNGITWASSTFKTVTVGTGTVTTTTGRIIGITSTSIGNNIAFTIDTKEMGFVTIPQFKLKITSYDGHVFGTPTVSSVITVDNTPLISLSKLTLSPTRAVVNAAPDYLTIKLNSRPTNDVTITPIQSIDNLLSLSPTFFTFTPDNWNAAQNLVVYASSSQATIGSLTFVSSSTDSNFHNLTPVAPTTVAVTITAVSNGNSSSGSSSGSSGSSGSSSSSSSAGTVVVSPTVTSNNQPTQVVSNNQPTTITSPATQTVQTTSSFTPNNTSASLVIPAGTITTPATLQIKASESISAPLPIASTQTFNSSPIGDVVFDISLKDHATQTNITSFSSSNLQLTINIPTISSTEDTSLLGLYYLNETTNQWIRVDSASFNLSTKQVTASLNHLTKFAVFKSTDKVLNTGETSPSDFVKTPSDVKADQPLVGTTTPVSLPLLTTKQLSTYKGKFISDKNNNIFFVNTKTNKIEIVNAKNAIIYLAKTATGIKNKDLIKISNITDKKVSSFSKKFLTKVLMAVEDKGQLWYVNKDGKKAKVYDAIGLARVLAVRVR